VPVLKNVMQLNDFNFDLPENFIAQSPAFPRDSSKLFVFDTKNDKIYHKKFFQIIEFLSKGDVLISNKSKVIKCRLIFSYQGKQIEIFVIKELQKNIFNALIKPGKLFKLGNILNINDDLKIEVTKILPDGSRNLTFICDHDFDFEKYGSIPLPPYIEDNAKYYESYQTVYADQTKSGSLAAPTAGLHFSEKLLSQLKTMQIPFENVVLHVGRGTFEPVKTENIFDHKMHSELYEIDENTANNLNTYKAQEKRLIAIGTTTVRTLESNFTKFKKFQSEMSETEIFILPGIYKWKTVEGLITNFHLPKSTLLMLVASFLEHKGVKDPVKRLLELYEIAKIENYRFYSFGDAMFIF